MTCLLDRWVQVKSLLVEKREIKNLSKLFTLFHVFKDPKEKSSPALLETVVPVWFLELRW